MGSNLERKRFYFFDYASRQRRAASFTDRHSVYIRLARLAERECAPPSGGARRPGPPGFRPVARARATPRAAAGAAGRPGGAGVRGPYRRAGPISAGIRSYS